MFNFAVRAAHRCRAAFDRCRTENDSISEEVTAANVRRIYNTTLMAIPVHLVHIALFLFAVQDGTPVRALWRNGIIVSHTVLLSAMIFFHFAARQRIRDGTSLKKLGAALSYSMVALLMAAGVVIASIDQLVTSNITPFLVVCLITGAVLLIRPLAAAVIFLLSYAAFYPGVGVWSAANADVLLSNRVNGITAIGIGMALSYIMWRYNVIMVRQRRQIESQREELACIAFYDPLTGIHNRRHFEEVVKREMAFTRRQSRVSSLVMMDIDFFKKVNDTYGHPAGDQVLSRIAGLVTESIRDCDTACRYGGEEFLILLPGAAPEEAAAIAERLRVRIEETVFRAAEIDISLTASFGVAVLPSGMDNGSDSCFKEADNALYRAKHEGRNCVRSAVLASR